MASSGSSYHSYHCLCSQFILVTTQPLGSFKQRDGDAVDKAYILPLIQSPTSSVDVDGNSSIQPTQFSTAAQASSSGEGKGKAPEASSALEKQYAVVETAAIIPPSKTPLIVMRSDGFEPRFQVKCARCNLVLGYHLDKSLFKDRPISGQDEDREGPREDVLYVLRDALKSLE
jgi:hypothetical protein